MPPVSWSIYRKTMSVGTGEAVPAPEPFTRNATAISEGNIRQGKRSENWPLSMVCRRTRFGGFCISRPLGGLKSAGNKKLIKCVKKEVKYCDETKRNK